MFWHLVPVVSGSVLVSDVIGGDGGDVWMCVGEHGASWRQQSASFLVGSRSVVSTVSVADLQTNACFVRHTSSAQKRVHCGSLSRISQSIFVPFLNPPLQPCDKQAIVGSAKHVVRIRIVRSVYSITKQSCVHAVDVRNHLLHALRIDKRPSVRMLRMIASKLSLS